MPTDTRKRQVCRWFSRNIIGKKCLQRPLFSPSLCHSHTHLCAHTGHSVWSCLLQGESVTTWGGHGVELSWALSQSQSDTVREQLTPQSGGVRGVWTCICMCVWMRGCVYILRWAFVSVCLCVAWAITCLFVCLNSEYVRQEPVDCVSVWFRPVDPLSYSQGQGGITQVTQQQQGMANCLCLHDFTLQLLHLHVLRLCFWHCSCLISPL